MPCTPSPHSEVRRSADKASLQDREVATEATRRQNGGARRRPLRGVALASALFLLSGLLVGGASGGAGALVSGLSNAAIVSAAAAYPDGSTVGDGQCWSFMRQVVLTATGGRVAVGKNNNYYASYADVGGELVGRDSAQPGDIIQKYNPSNHTDSTRVHTAIVLGHAAGSNTFSVIDQNYASTGKVLRHSYDPWASLPAGWAVAIWRLGTVSGSGQIDVSQYAGHLVQWADEKPSPVTTWLVGPDLTRTWIPDGGTYNWMKAAGAPGPTRLSSSALNALIDRTGVRAYTDQLGVNWSAVRGTMVWSNGGGYLAAFQGDGNFVVYAPGGRAVWASRTNGARVIMQSDGNLVIYNASNGAVWASGTVGHGRSRLVMQGDGNLVLYRADGRAIWATMTNGGTNRLGSPGGFRL